MVRSYNAATALSIFNVLNFGFCSLLLQASASVYKSFEST